MGAVGVAQSDVWIVGLYQDKAPAVPLAEHWNGKAWAVAEVPVGPWGVAAHLTAVDALAADDVWAVGAGQNVGEEQTLIERWDGSVWTIVPSPNASARTNELSGVDMIAASDGWAVGDYYGAERDLALTEHWDGHSWSIVDAANPAKGMNVLYGVAGTAPDDVWAVGFSRESDQASPRVLIEHWDGTRWNLVSSPSPGRTASLSKITATSSRDVWVAGTYDNGTTFVPLVEHWDGHTWNVMPSPRATDAMVQTLVVRDSTDVWIAGGASTHGGYGWMIQHWDGGHWTDAALSQRPNGVVSSLVMDSGALWAIGSHRPVRCGADLAWIERWDGNTWSYVKSPNDGRA